MVPTDFQTFINELEKADELARISCPVDARLEIAAIVNRACKKKPNKALLFEAVRGHQVPLVTNLFGSSRRMEICFGVGDLETLSSRLQQDLASTGETGSVTAFEKVMSHSRAQFKVTGELSSTDLIVAPQGLKTFPALTSWPQDGGPYLTLAQVFTRHPDTGQSNCGLYRIQIIDSHKALLRCHPGSGGAQHLTAWHQRGEPMPIAVALGGPPALTWASSASLPSTVLESDVAGYLTGRPVPMVRCQESPLVVPEQAEIIIEGAILPNEEMPEGPFGNHTGFYAPKALAPVIRVGRVLMKHNAIYPCTVVGPPPMENIYLGRFSKQILLSLLQFDFPWVHDVHMPFWGIFHKASFVAIKNSCALSGQDIHEALLCSQLLKGSKVLVLADQDAAIDDLDVMGWQLLNRSTLDHDGHPLILDLRVTRKNSTVEHPKALTEAVAARWKDFGL